MFCQFNSLFIKPSLKYFILTKRKKIMFSNFSSPHDQNTHHIQWLSIQTSNGSRCSAFHALCNICLRLYRTEWTIQNHSPITLSLAHPHSIIAFLPNLGTQTVRWIHSHAIMGPSAIGPNFKPLMARCFLVEVAC